MFGEVVVTAMSKSKRISWARHIWRARHHKMRHTECAPKGERPLERLRQGQVDRVESDL